MQQKLILIKGLPFSNIVHKVLTLDAQPASSSIAAIMVLVTGQLLVDDGQNVLQYSQMFHVSPETFHIRFMYIQGYQADADGTARSRGTGLLCSERRFPIVSRNLVMPHRIG
jgi:hypothetical protein